MIELHSFPFSALGTECNLHFYAASRAAAGEASRVAIEEVYRIEDRYSRYHPESFLSGINRAARSGGTIEVDEETGALLDYAFACHETSGGMFDITSGILRNAWDFSSGRLPGPARIAELLARVGLDKIRWEAPRLSFAVPGMELDLGGIGKEYAADRAAELLAGQGIVHGLVDLGGDINVIGPHPNGDPWRIEIRHPRKPEAIAGAVELSRGGFASSGDYERCMVIGGVRYSHIISPVTGWPVHGLASVSVAADRCVVAGSLCTIALLQGREGADWLAGLDLPYHWVDEQGAQGGTLELVE